MLLSCYHYCFKSTVKAEILNFGGRDVCDSMLYVHIKDGY